MWRNVFLMTAMGTLAMCGAASAQTRGGYVEASGGFATTDGVTSGAVSTEVGIHLSKLVSVFGSRSAGTSSAMSARTRTANLKTDCPSIRKNGSPVTCPPLI